MTLSHEIKAIDGKGIIARCFGPESKELLGGRASYQIEENGMDVIFHISAKDETALKATKNSVEKMLQVIRQMEEIR